MERYVVFRNVCSSSTEKLLNYLRQHIRINVRMGNCHSYVWSIWRIGGGKFQPNSAPIFKPRFLLKLGFKTMGTNRRIFYVTCLFSIRSFKPYVRVGCKKIKKPFNIRTYGFGWVMTRQVFTKIIWNILGTYVPSMAELFSCWSLVQNAYVLRSISNYFSFILLYISHMR